MALTRTKEKDALMDGVRLLVEILTIFFEEMCIIFFYIITKCFFLFTFLVFSALI